MSYRASAANIPEAGTGPHFLHAFVYFLPFPQPIPDVSNHGLPSACQLKLQLVFGYTVHLHNLRTVKSLIYYNLHPVSGQARTRKDKKIKAFGIAERRRLLNSPSNPHYRLTDIQSYQRLVHIGFHFRHFGPARASQKAMSLSIVLLACSIFFMSKTEVKKLCNFSERGISFFKRHN